MNKLTRMTSSYIILIVGLLNMCMSSHSHVTAVWLSLACRWAKAASRMYADDFKIKWAEKALTFPVTETIYSCTGNMQSMEIKNQRK